MINRLLRDAEGTERKKRDEEREESRNQGRRKEEGGEKGAGNREKDKSESDTERVGLLILNHPSRSQ